MFIFRFYIRYQGRLTQVTQNGFSLMEAFDKVTTAYADATYVNHFQVK